MNAEKNADKKLVDELTKKCIKILAEEDKKTGKILTLL